jgi:hypothetical protein
VNLAAGTNLGFYEAAAQVIPVLLLVMAFGESRLRVSNPKRATYADAYYILAGFLIVVFGEVAALRVLLMNDDGGGLHALTVAGIAYGLMFIVFRFGFQTMADMRRKPGEEDVEATAGEIYFVMLLSIATWAGIYFLLSP